MGADAVPVVAAVVSVVGAVITVVLGAVFERRRSWAQRRTRLRHVASRYSVSLLQAAHSLRTRLGNAVADQIREFGDGPDRFRDYARYESVYRLARYLSVVQIMWHEVDFLDLGRRKHNKKLIERLAAVGSALSDRTSGRLLVLGGEQRALGDLMVDPESPADGPPICMSYPAFRNRLDQDERFATWFAPLLNDVDALVAGEPVPARLSRVIQALDELIEFLDERRIGRPWGDPASAV